MGFLSDLVFLIMVVLTSYTAFLIITFIMELLADRKNWKTNISFVVLMVMLLVLDFITFSIFWKGL